MVYGKMGSKEEDIFWEEIGRLQFTFMVKEGLKPSDYLLDVGCGPLRGGEYFIKYLEDSHYFGVDADPEALKRAREITKNLGKRAKFLLNSKFQFEKLNQTFDFALAQGLFCHLTDKEIKTCLKKIAKVLKPGGKFYASFFEGGKEPIKRTKGFYPATITYRDKNPFHQPLEFYLKNCPEELEVKYLGEWNHPRGLVMIMFRKKEVK